MILKHYFSDNGFCRVYYRNANNHQNLYAFQMDTPGNFSLYVCSRDGEPSYEANLSSVQSVQVPKGDNRIDRELTAWLEKQGF